MGKVITPDKFSGNNNYRVLREEMREFHYLREPNNYSSGMAWGDLGYQMQYSVESLESLLEEEGAYDAHNRYWFRVTPMAFPCFADRGGLDTGRTG